MTRHPGMQEKLKKRNKNVERLAEMSRADVGGKKGTRELAEPGTLSKNILSAVAAN